MARLALNDPRVLDSTGRTVQNGGIMPPSQPTTAKLPIAGTSVAGLPVSPTTPATAPVPLAQQGLVSVSPQQTSATPYGVQTLGPVPTSASAVQPAPTPVASTGAPLSLSLPGITGSDYYAGTGATSVPGVSTGTSQQVNVPTLGTGWTVPSASTSGSTVQDYLNGLLSENGSYLQNASRRGLETANSRGMLNGSIAAGASSRAAIEAAQPILDQIMNLNNAREGMSFTQGENTLNRTLQERLQAQGFNFEGGQNDLNRKLQSSLQSQNLGFQGQQNSLDRAQSVNNQLLQGTLQERMARLGADINSNAAQQDFEFRRTLQGDQAAQQDWLATNQFNNQFNANLSMIPVTSSMQMLQALSQYALEDPETYTPEVMSGFTTFFNNNMVNLLQQYFPNSGGNS